ncbi:hypothetical protein ACLOJK_033747 [Asimina triloba]
MMKLRTYAGVSFVGAAAIIYHAFSSRGQFYPATVYLSTSKISLVLLMNLSLVIMCIIWQMIKSLFLGSLREAEVETLNEQSWREVMETIFTITIFRQDFSVTFLALVTTLLLIKALHWLAQKRVEYIETTPSVPKLSHIRIASFLVFLLVVDTLIFYSFLNYLIQTRRPSVALFFVFDVKLFFALGANNCLSAILVGNILIQDLIACNGRLSYGASLASIAHIPKANMGKSKCMHAWSICHSPVIDLLMEGQWERKAVYTFYLELVRDLLHLSMYYGLPLNLIREIYWTFHNFKVRVADYLRYRKITSNMNERFPDATPEELEAALVVPPENGTVQNGVRHEVQPESHPQGSGLAGTSTQVPEGNNAVDDTMRHHQARLQAAAAAASMYEKSFVYPSANTIVWTPGYALLPQVYMPAGHGGNANSNTEAPTSRNCHQNGGKSNPYNLNMAGSQVEAWERFIRHQIETCRDSNRVTSEGAVPAAPDERRKAADIGAASASTSNCGHQEEIEEAEKD